MTIDIDSIMAGFRSDEGFEDLPSIKTQRAVLDGRALCDEIERLRDNERELTDVYASVMNEVGTCVDDNVEKHCPCVPWLRKEVTSLRGVISNLLHRRKCLSCKEEAWYSSAIIPGCTCRGCGSLATRRIKGLPWEEENE